MNDIFVPQVSRMGILMEQWGADSAVAGYEAVV